MHLRRKCYFLQICKTAKKMDSPDRGIIDGPDESESHEENMQQGTDESKRSKEYPEILGIYDLGSKYKKDESLCFNHFKHHAKKFTCIDNAVDQSEQWIPIKPLPIDLNEVLSLKDYSYTCITKDKILYDRGKIQMDEVIGLTEEKEKLKEVILLPDRFPQLFQGERKPDYGACLIYGAPGCGKTYLARAVGSEITSKFLHVVGSEFISKWLGDGEKLITELFKYAKSHKPCVIFIDDVDMICNREDKSDFARVVHTEFMVQLEECRKHEIQVLAATSIPWKIEDSVMKRFWKMIYLPLPDQIVRAEMLRNFFLNTKHSLKLEDFNVIASKTDGFTGADLSVLVRDALMEPVRKVQSATHFCKTNGPSNDNPEVTVDDLFTPCLPDTPGAIEMNWMAVPPEKFMEPIVSMEDLLHALSRMRPSISEEELKEFTDYKNMVESQK